MRQARDSSGLPEHRPVSNLWPLAARRQSCRDNATAENSFLGAKRHMGRMGNIVIIWQIRMDCTGCQTALGCQWHNSPHGSESAARRVSPSRRHQRDIFGQRDLTAANCRFKKRRAHDEPLWCRIGQIDRRGVSAMSSSSKLWTIIAPDRQRGWSRS